MMANLERRALNVTRSDSAQAPTVLVAIANYGTAQDQYLSRLLCEYKKLHMRVRVVVLSNQEKCVPGAEVIAGLPSPDPYSLPFAHRKLFAENADRYDLFIYSEDDTLITEQHIRAFFEAQSQLEEDEIPGFLRSEAGSDDRAVITSIHNHFRWLPESVVERGGELFAQLSNQHSGCFMVTRRQLRKAISSGGFLVPPHAESYGMLETAASDLYTQCGLRRLICLSRIRDFIVPHLPNKYYWYRGISIEELELQARALQSLRQNGGWTGKLFEPGNCGPSFRWSIDLYKRCDEELARVIPPEAGTILSVGCGWGENEARLKREGKNVCAVPLDAVFSASLDYRGIRTVTGPLKDAIKSLNGQQFDVVLLPDVLHLVENPVEWLRVLVGVLHNEGKLIARVANTCELTSRIRDLRLVSRSPVVSTYRSGVQEVNVRRLRNWCRAAGLKATSIVPAVEDSRRDLRRWAVSVLGPAFAPRLILTASRSQSDR